MHIEMVRERETRPGDWVKATIAAAGLDEERVAVRVRKRTSTIYRWEKLGIEYLDWIGLIAVVGLLDLEEDDIRKRLTKAGMKSDQIRAFVDDHREARALACTAAKK